MVYHFLFLIFLNSFLYSFSTNSLFNSKLNTLSFLAVNVDQNQKEFEFYYELFKSCYEKKNLQITKENFNEIAPIFDEQDCHRKNILLHWGDDSNNTNFLTYFEANLIIKNYTQIEELLKKNSNEIIFNDFIKRYNISDKALIDKNYMSEIQQEEFKLSIMPFMLTLFYKNKKRYDFFPYQEKDLNQMYLLLIQNQNVFNKSKVLLTILGKYFSIKDQKEINFFTPYQTLKINNNEIEKFSNEALTIIFSTTWCKYCKELLNFISENNQIV